MTSMLGIDLEETPTDRPPPAKVVVTPQTMEQLGELIRDWLAEAEQRVAERWNAVEKKLEAIDIKLAGVPGLIEKLQITTNDAMVTRASQGLVAVKQYDTVKRLEALELRLNINGQEGTRS